MAINIDEAAASQAEDKGILIGTLEPKRESKGAWSQVFFYNGELFSIIYSDPVDAWIVAGEKIEKSELAKYVDNHEETLLKLQSVSRG